MVDPQVLRSAGLSPPGRCSTRTSTVGRSAPARGPVGLLEYGADVPEVRMGPPRVSRCAHLRGLADVAGGLEWGNNESSGADAEGKPRRIMRRSDGTETLAIRSDNRGPGARLTVRCAWGTPPSSGVFDHQFGAGGGTRSPWRVANQGGRVCQFLTGPRWTSTAAGGASRKVRRGDDDPPCYAPLPPRPGPLRSEGRRLATRAGHFEDAVEQALDAESALDLAGECRALLDRAGLLASRGPGAMERVGG